MTSPQRAPGVRVQEVSPGSPIVGAGTSTAAFVGVALDGEPGVPRLITSYDGFQRTYGDGGPLPGPSRTFARAVLGFFLNGGTAAYVLRVSSGGRAFVDLPSHKAGPNPPPALTATARTEGQAGNTIKVKVSEVSLLSDRLTAAGAPGPTLAIRTVRRNVTSVTEGRRLLLVDSADGFAAGDKVKVTKAGLPDAAATVSAVEGANQLRLQAALGNAANDYGGGTVQATGVPAGRRELLVDVPSGLRLSDGVPAGAVVRITAGGGVDEPNLVLATGTDRLTLAQPTTARLDLSQTPVLATREFQLEVTGGVPGTFRFLSTTPGHPRYWGDIVDSPSIELTEPAVPPDGVTDPRPVAATYDLHDGRNDDQQAAWGLVTSDATVLAPLERLDEVSLVCVPGLTGWPAQQAVIEHCERMGDRFAILDPPAGAGLDAILTHRDRLRSERGYAALYYPNLLVRNSTTGTNEPQPPSGHLAGVFARSDDQVGVFKAPANEVIRGAVGLETPLTDNDQAPLNQRAVNGLRSFRGGPPMVWGARTLAEDRNYQYVNVRRLLIFLAESLRASLAGAVFAPNDVRLWKRLDRTIRGFLTAVWRDGALFGATADDAFTVQIDEVNNPEESRNNGILNIWLFVAPTRPAEFIFVEIGLLVGDNR